MLRIGALWRGKTEGKASATGQVNLPEGVMLSVPNGQRLVLMPNTNEGRSERSPDWYLFLADSEDQKNETPPPSGSGEL